MSHPETQPNPGQADDERPQWLRGVRLVVGPVALAGMLALAGCGTSGGDATADASASPGPQHGTVAAPAAQATPGDVTDADTCVAIGDVVSIGFNVDLAISEGRMSTQEQSGWYRLATIVLDRVPTRGEGPVSETVAALQAVAPPVALAAMGRTEIGSDEWRQHLSAVFQACEDAGSEIATAAFTGG